MKEPGRPNSDTDEDELDIESPKFNPLKALYSKKFKAPFENVKLYDNFDARLQSKEQEQKSPRRRKVNEPPTTEPEAPIETKLSESHRGGKKLESEETTQTETNTRGKRLSTLQTLEPDEPEIKKIRRGKTRKAEAKETQESQLSNLSHSYDGPRFD